MALQPFKEVVHFERPQGTITRITCWMTEGNEVIGTFDNCYVIETGGRHVLIDTLRAFYWDLLRPELDKTGIDAIVLTHGHFDHCQNTHAIVERYGAPVAISESDLTLVEDQLSQPITANTEVGLGLLDYANQEFREQKVQSFPVDLFLHDGTSLEDFGLDAYVFETPGHTQGHMGIDLWDSDLFVGDILMNPGEPVRAMLFFDADGIEQSVKRIEAIEGDRTIHFGHGSEVRLSELAL